MHNAATPQTVHAALVESLGDGVQDPFQNRLALHFENGQRLTAVFDPDTGHISLTTPVNGAHAGLPTSMLARLLQRNAPDGDLAGGSLRVRPRQDYLEILNVVPSTLGAVAIAQIVVNQANAAAALVQLIRDELLSAA